MGRINRPGPEPRAMCRGPFDGITDGHIHQCRMSRDSEVLLDELLVIA